MKPYQQIPIVECGEPLVAVPLELFVVESPHPYVKVGATYGDRSPYYLRQSVLASLIAAQSLLQVSHPHWRIQIFDAYRPVEVQQFMVEYSFGEVVQARGLNFPLEDAQRQAIWEQVYEFWAPPSLNPATPPPHSTGAAVDVTLVAATGERIDMGGEIDEISERSHPDYFAGATSKVKQQYHAHRQLLGKAMFQAGFRRHPNEWWHFSLGDQMWAWLYNQENPPHQVVARYGRVP